MSVTAAALRELHQHSSATGRPARSRGAGPEADPGPRGERRPAQGPAGRGPRPRQETQMAINRKQLDLKAGEQKIVDLRVKLNAASSNREYQALVEQIAAAEMAGSVLADEILEVDGKDRSACSVAVKEAEKTAGRRQAGTGKDAPRDRRFGRLAPRRHRAARSRAWRRPRSALPADFKADYQRVVRSKGADGLAAVDDGVCAGCGQQITLNMQNELRLSQLVFCKSCGRLLYLSE